MVNDRPQAIGPLPADRHPSTFSRVFFDRAFLTEFSLRFFSLSLFHCPFL
jgi:hypothetical protein